MIQRAEPELGLNVDEERIQDHMPRPAKLDGTDLPTKLLGTLVHWVMRNNLLTRLNMYTRKPVKTFMSHTQSLRELFEEFGKKEGHTTQGWNRSRRRVRTKPPRGSTRL